MRDSRAEHVVARALRIEVDVQYGNHWITCVETAAAADTVAPVLHPPCDGRICGAVGMGYICVAPLAVQVYACGLRLLPCQARGDCAIDCMVYWDGIVGAASTWKALRLELAAAVRGNAR